MADFYNPDDDLNYFGDEPSPELKKQRTGRLLTAIGALAASLAITLFPSNTERQAWVVNAENNCTGQDLAKIKPGTSVEAYAARLQTDGVGGETKDIAEQLTATNPASIVVINGIPAFTGEHKIFIPESCELPTQLDSATQQS